LFRPLFTVFPYAGPLAQLAEQRTFNPRVPGSTPGRPTHVCGEGRWKARQGGQNPDKLIN
jgi:hypothetical protein